MNPLRPCQIQPALRPANGSESAWFTEKRTAVGIGVAALGLQHERLHATTRFQKEFVRSKELASLLSLIKLAGPAALGHGCRDQV